MPTQNTTPDSAFAMDVRKGLTDFPKHLPSRYIYDEKGDALFQRIMKLTEYYLTDCETEIFEIHKTEMAQQLGQSGPGFNLIELGAGDGTKTTILLREMLRLGLEFTYQPIDISANALNGLTHRLKKTFPKLKVIPREGTYFEMLRQIDKDSKGPKSILFLGSNIGNLLHPQAREFLKALSESMGSRDQLLIGFDQKKHPATILQAYNDATGITEAFNKNLLLRINRELGGNFDPDGFLHWETYDPESGTAKSYLVARQAMQVRIERLNLQIAFREWETIHTEISQKYDDPVVEWLASESGLEVRSFYADSRQYYKDYLFHRAGT